MPNWLRHWRDWALADWWYPTRSNHELDLQRSPIPEQQSFHFAYEMDGQTVRHEPIPWCADQAFVDVLLRFPPGLVRRKSDFQLRLEDAAPVAPSSLRPAEEGQDWLRFPLPVPQQPALMELRFRNKLLGQAAIPFVSESQFLDHLQVLWPTLSVHMGAHTVACQAFIGQQCKGLIMGGLLTSPTSLLPLRRLDLAIEVIEPKDSRKQRLPIQLPAQHWCGREAMVQVAALERIRRMGLGHVRWRVGEHILANKEFQVLSKSALNSAAQLLGHQYVHRDAKQQVKLLKYPPKDETGWLGVCFFLGSSLPGLAATVQVQVNLVGKQEATRKEFMDNVELLLTDGPTPFFSPMVRMADLHSIEAIELCSQGRRVGTVLFRPIPHAQFTSEGGFKMGEADVNWTSIAEDELQIRLKKLGTKIPW